MILYDFEIEFVLELGTGLVALEVGVEVEAELELGAGHDTGQDADAGLYADVKVGNEIVIEFADEVVVVEEAEAGVEIGNEFVIEAVAEVEADN